MSKQKNNLKNSIDRYTKIYLFIALSASVLGLISDIRYFSPNIFLGILALINYIPLIIIYISSIPYIVYIIKIEIPKKFLIIPIIYIISIIFYITFIILTNGSGLDNTFDYILSTIINFVIIFLSIYLIYKK